MKNSLAGKLSVWICSFLTVFLLGTIGIVSVKWYHALTENLNENGCSVVREMSNRLDKTFLQLQMAGEFIARQLETLELDRTTFPDQMRSWFDSVSLESPDCIGLCVAFDQKTFSPQEDYNAFIAFKLDGKYQFAHWNNERIDYFHKDWFLAPFTLKKPIWTRPYRANAIGHEMLASYACPFYRQINGQRKVAGVVVVDLTIRTLEKYLRSINIPGSERINESCMTFLMNQFGQITIAPTKEREIDQSIFSLCEEADAPDPIERENARLIFKEQGSGKLSFRKAPILPEPCELFYSTCANQWVVAVAVPQQWRNAIVIPLLSRFILYGILFLTLIVIVIFVVTRHLHRPLVELAHATETIGNGNFSSSLPNCSTRDEIGVLTESFGRMQKDLTEYIRMLEENIVLRERSEWELNAAKKIQHDLLPHILPPFEKYENINGAAVLRPARGVGGDLYDVFPVGSNSLAIIIGDVSGKGVPASLFMAVTQTLQRSIALTESDPERIVSKLNTVLGSNNESSMFVTYWLGLLDIRTGVLRFANGGHNAPILCRIDGSCSYQKSEFGLPLGIMPDAQYHSEQVVLNVGDMLILYTDGVTEALNKDGELFGEERFLSLVQNSKSRTPGEMLERIESSLAQYTDGAHQSDDITILVIQMERQCS